VPTGIGHRRGTDCGGNPFHFVPQIHSRCNRCREKIQIFSPAPEKPQMFVEEQLSRNAPLSRMANDTEGIFFHSNNDIHTGLWSIVHRHSSYYVLSYYASQQKADGHYRHIKVEVSRSGLELSYRKGYYAPREDLTFEQRKRRISWKHCRCPTI
jgi:hypothetical protein